MVNELEVPGIVYINYIIHACLYYRTERNRSKTATSLLAKMIHTTLPHTHTISALIIYASTTHPNRKSHTHKHTYILYEAIQPRIKSRLQKHAIFRKPAMRRCIIARFISANKLTPPLRVVPPI